MKVLLIDHQDSFTYNLSQLLERCGAAVDIISYEEDFNHIQHKYSKIILSPGPGVPLEYPKTIDLLKNNKNDIDIFGVCLGMQCIAIAFGGSLYRQNTVRHGNLTKILPIRATNPNLLNKLGDFQAILYHSWAVIRESLPSELEITAVSENGVIMGLRHRKFNIEGVQFHPESFQCPRGIDLIKNWLNRT